MLRLALDQNFPVPLLDSLQRWLPADTEIQSIASMDTRLPLLSDRNLFIALKDLGVDGLVSNNWRMLNQESEVASIIHTKAIAIFIKGMGHDPIRAAGALLLDLPNLAERVIPGVGNVFLLSHDRRRPTNAWQSLESIAGRHKVSASTLWKAQKPSEEEIGSLRAHMA